MIFRKRGVSAIIATVLVILITIAGVAIVAGFVIPFVRDNLERGTECVGLQDYLKFEESFKISGQDYRYNCFLKVEDTFYYGSSIRAKGDSANSEKVSGFSLVYMSPEGNSKSIKVFDGEINNELKGIGTAGDEKIKTPNSGDVLTYVHQSENAYSRIEVYPIVKSGRPCALSDSINLIPCSSNVQEVIKR